MSEKKPASPSDDLDRLLENSRKLLKEGEDKFAREERQFFNSIAYGCLVATGVLAVFVIACGGVAACVIWLVRAAIK